MNDLAAGKHSFAEVLKGAKHPIMLVGAAATGRYDGAAVLAMAAKVAIDFGAVKDGWNGFAFCSRPRRGSARSISALPRVEGGLNAAAMTTSARSTCCFRSAPTRSRCRTATFVVYIGTHGDNGAHRADVILPGAAYTEKQGLYVNTEGRVQMADRAAFPPGDAREDWAIIRALSDVLGKKLPYDSLAALRQAIFKAAPHLMRIDQIEAGDAAAIKTLAGKGGSVDKAPFKSRDRGLLPDQSDRARVGGDGGMFAAGFRPDPDGGGVSVKQ